jgi:hypothetical protein
MIKIMLGLLTAVLLFHILVLFRIIPYEIVWAGKLNSVNDMYTFESMSILINSILITTLLLKGEYLKLQIPEKIINGILWFFVILFALNTVGNLLAKTVFEKAVFAPLTLISSILLWKIVNKKVQHN